MSMKHDCQICKDHSGERDAVAKITPLSQMESEMQSKTYSTSMVFGKKQKRSQKTMTTEVKRIRLEDLDPNLIDNSQFQLRSSLNVEKFNELKDSIFQVGGNLVPITVMQRGFDLITISGHRRVEACIELGLPVKAEIIEDVPDVDATCMAFTLNLNF